MAAAADDGHDDAHGAVASPTLPDAPTFPDAGDAGDSYDAPAHSSLPGAHSTDAAEMRLREMLAQSVLTDELQTGFYSNGSGGSGGSGVNHGRIARSVKSQRRFHARLNVLAGTRMVGSFLVMLTYAQFDDVATFHQTGCRVLRIVAVQLGVGCRW